MISIESVSKRYGRHGVVALDCVSLKLPNKGLVSLVGENGCGKTTLLNVLSTIDKPDSGKVYYNNIQYNKKSFRYLRNQIISYIQQEDVFSDYLSIYDHIRIEGINDDQISLELKRLNIEDKIYSKASTLSGGQRQKSSVIRGILKMSSVLLVDEPTSSMDEEMEEKTFQILKGISKTKLVVIVSHNMQMVKEYSDLIIHMERGRITSVVNTSYRELIVKENVISVPDDHLVLLSDWQTIQNVLRKNKKVILKTHIEKDDESNKRKLDYSVQNTNCSKKKKNSTRIVGHIAQKSLTNSFLRIILSSVFVALLVVLTGVSLCLGNVNVSRFEYDMFQKNGYEFVNFSKNKNISAFDRERKNDFNREDYEHFQNERGAMSVMLSDFEEVTLGFNYNEVYSSIISGFAIIKDESQVSLLSGSLPADNQILITDYLADSMILNDVYTSYDEIIDSGIELNNYNFRVSGILSSGYKTLLKQMDSTSFKDSEDYLYWCYMVEDVFSRLYTMYSESTSGYHLSMIPIFNGKLFADIQVREDLFDSTLSLNNRVFVNSVLFENLAGLDMIKTANGAYTIADVVDDEESNPIIYVSLNQYNALCRIPFEFSSFNLAVGDYSSYEYIKAYDVQHNTPLSSTINKAINVVQIIGVYLKPIVIICTFCTVVLSSVFWFDLASKDRFALYSLIINGYSGFQIYFFNMFKMMVKMLVEITFSSVFFYGIAKGINKILSVVSKITMVLIPYSPKVLLESFVPYAVVMLIIAVLITIKTRFSMPIMLFERSKNG